MVFIGVKNLYNVTSVIPLTRTFLPLTKLLLYHIPPL